MAGMIDPDKCNAAKVHLLMTTLNYFTSISSVRDLAIGRQLNSFQIMTLPTLPPLAVLQSRVRPDKSFLYNRAVKQVWDDCDIGGGLKRKLEQFKAKASEVAGKLLPTPSPVPVGASCEAIDLPVAIGSEMFLHEPSVREVLAGYGILAGSLAMGGALVASPYLIPAMPEVAPIFAGAAAL